MSTKDLLAPLVVLELYLAATVIAFFFGPWDWPISNPVLLLMYLLAAQAALAVGYLAAIGGFFGTFRRTISTTRPWLVACKACIAGTFVAAVIGIVNNSDAVRDGSSITDVIWESISAPAEAYRNKGENLRLIGEGIPQRFSLPLEILSTAALPLGIAFWPRLSRTWRTAFFISRMAEMSVWLVSGTTKGIADTLVVGGIFAACLYTRDLSTRGRATFVAVVLGAIITTGVFFGESKVGERPEVAMADISLPIVADAQHPFLEMLPRSLSPVACLLANYLTQGYYALSNSFDFPFVWCSFVGHGPFTTELVASLGFDNIARDTYPGRMEATGWSSTVRWHTMYVWLASDLGHFGVLIFTLTMGYLLAATWRETIHRSCGFSVILSFLLIQMFLYAPANNQVLAFPASACVFWVSILGRAVFVSRGL
jgi:hypothetical protein